MLLLAAETSGGGRRPRQRSVLPGSVWACFRGSSAGLPGISCGCVWGLAAGRAPTSPRQPLTCWGVRCRAAPRCASSPRAPPRRPFTLLGGETVLFGARVPTQLAPESEPSPNACWPVSPWPETSPDEARSQECWDCAGVVGRRRGGRRGRERSGAAGLGSSAGCKAQGPCSRSILFCVGVPVMNVALRWMPGFAAEGSVAALRELMKPSGTQV